MSIIIFLLVLSFLVFFHELGHFLAAKACGIYVDRFSIGMPPRVVGFKWGETDYCIGALPIGGFVKMAGQEDAPLTEEERAKEYGGVPPERWFNNKPVWQRIIVILAGPVANLILAVLLYGLLAGMGKEVAESEITARIGFVEENTPAATAPLFKISASGESVDFEETPDTIGFQPGDLLYTLNGQPVQDIQTFSTKVLLKGEETAHVIEIERPGATDDAPPQLLVCKLKPVTMEGEEFPRFGVHPFASVRVANVLDDTPAKAAGLQEGDIVRRANGDVVSIESFGTLVQDMPEGESVDLSVKRDDTLIPLTITPHTTGRFRNFVLGADGKGEDAENGPAVVLKVKPEFREETGLQRKDVITAIDGKPVTYREAADLVLASPGKTFSATVERPQLLFGLAQKASTETIELTVDPVRTIGIEMREEFILHRVPASQIVPEAFRQSWYAFTTTVETLQALVMQNVSPDNLGGPVMIYQMTTHFAQRGFGWLVGITALISVNLAVFNLLPLPVLDGGLLVINSIEGIRRKPLNPAFLEKFQMAGLVLIVGLMLFVTFNDVGRLLDNFIP